MHYLESQKVTHRFLCLRNVLLFQDNTESFQAKVSDYGLSAYLGEKITWNELETAKTSANSIVRWQCPEALSSRKYSQSRDIWSFGICLWELLCDGKTPYEQWTVPQVVERVGAGFRLEIPDVLPLTHKLIIEACWENLNPPNFCKMETLLSKAEAESNK